MHKTVNGDAIVVQIELILFPEFMPKRPCKYTSYNKSERHEWHFGSMAEYFILYVGFGTGVAVYEAIIIIIF